MYRQTVIPLNKSKYIKASEPLPWLLVMILCMLVSTVTIGCVRSVIVPGVEVPCLYSH